MTSRFPILIGSGLLRLRKLFQPIARQLFDRPAKAGANFFQIASAATGKFCDRNFATLVSK